MNKQSKKTVPGQTRMKRFVPLFLAILIPFVLLVGGCAFEAENPFSESSADSSAAESSSAGTSSAAEASSEEEIPLPEDEVIRFVACGDNILHPSVYYYGMEVYAEEHGQSCTYAAANDDRYDFHPIYENVAPAMKEADICYINQETLFKGGENAAVSGYPRFNSPEIIGTTLYDLGVDVVNLAHNHMLDCGSDEAVRYSAGFFRQLGMTPIGYYESEADTENIVIYETKGVKIAFLAYTEHTNGIPDNYPAYIPYFDDALVSKQVALAKQQADLVIVSAHWGNEYAWNPSSSQKHNADLLCSLGVDVVIGMHPHCIEPMEWRTNADGHKTLLAYSIGNFLSGMHEGMCHLEGMLQFDIRKDAATGKVTVEKPQFVPLVMHFEAGKSVNTQVDTGYRGFRIYYLSDYTEELAASHGIHKREREFRNYQLNGGEFTRECLINTVKAVIPAEFLPAEFAG